ncbi:hypothetical protein [Adhaeretor mobilis]|uniref:Uncharacterized protein n=1 Tax=Adhaeretor mobilis TaxID=1930276 RepID=A0A517MRM9_9BACT|nr:hypothetical protein [Adhaeretor mobilis]QDS97539.1 hypothetical protein HG15A2_08020 [Adhaeretor mobilis]
MRSFLAITLMLLPSIAWACPFCTTPMQTLSEELDEADAAVIARLETPMPELEVGELSSGEDDFAVFAVEESLRGTSAAAGDRVKLVYFGEAAPEKRFMITSFSLPLGEDEPITGAQVEWGTPLPLSEAAVKYVKKLESVPEEGPERLDFFQNYFEHEDPLLAQDAYDEFARAPYETIVAFSGSMDRSRLLDWINSPDVGPSSRRLYLTMLGVCGGPEDVAMLEKLLNFDYQDIKPGVGSTIAALSVGSSVGAGMLDTLVRAEDRRRKECLDALIACYLKLKGPAGLELVNERFFSNQNVSYTHLHMAVMALRFHGEETDVLPREKLLETMRLALDHPKFADQVVTDLTRWEDWEIMDRLVSMFRESDENAFIRMPVGSYLVVAAEQPGEVGKRARAAIEEFKELDPDTMRRIMLPLHSSALGSLSRAKNRPADEEIDAEVTDDTATDSAADTTSTAKLNTTVDQAVETGPGVDAGTSLSVNPNKTTAGADMVVPDAELAPVSVPSRLAMIGVAVLAGLVMFGIFAVLLRGSDPRSPRPENQA